MRWMRQHADIAAAVLTAIGLFAWGFLRPLPATVAYKREAIAAAQGRQVSANIVDGGPVASCDQLLGLDPGKCARMGWTNPGVPLPINPRHPDEEVTGSQ